MSKKLEELELKELQDVIGKINEASMQIGGLEIQKQEVISAAGEAKKELVEIQNKLESVYGKVSVDIKTGEISETEDESDS
jgi:cob(I)alamin adenosyltransferase